MAEKKEDDRIAKLEALMTAGLSKITRWIGKIKNQVTLPIAGGLSIYVVPVNPDAPDDLVGAKVFTVDEAGLPTETAVADGEIPLEDGTGRILVVAGGTVTEVKEAVNAAKLGEENAALKASNADLQAKLTAMEAQHAQVQAQATADKAEAHKEVAAIQNAFAEYKKLIPGDKEKKDDKEEDIIKMDFSKMTTAQKVRAMSKQRAKLEDERKELLNK